MQIGIVIPAFNAAPWIADCLGSVLAQTHEAWTAVVVDDGSTDATAALAAQFADPRIAVVRQDNAGVSTARNRGLEALPAIDAVLFLDADDWLASDALARLAAALETFPRAIAATGPCGFVPERARRGARPRRVKRPPAGDLFARLLERNLFANGGHLLIRRQVIEQAGRFRPDLAFGEDWEYWTRVAALGRIAAVHGRALLFVREREAGAYLRLAPDSGSFLACTKAIFDNPMVMRRYGRTGALYFQARAMSENLWVIGRTLLRYGRYGTGLSAMRRSVATKPSAKRIGLLMAAHLRGLARVLGG
ncbi:MAG TPA: glycosyltransferase family A protein [Acetobacteraceae bacterium]|nr:glycosyltransferase family A protein [Acetobacteraceae bacterium]